MITPDTTSINMPFDEAIEKEVLGALLLESSAMHRVATLLTPNSFYTAKHSLIYGAMLKLYNKNIPFSMLDVIQELKADKYINNVGGPLYINELVSTCATTTRVEYHAKVLRQLQMKRELINSAYKTISMAQDQYGDVADVLEATEKSLTDLQVNLNADILDMTQAVSGFFDEIQKKLEQGNDAISTGLTDLDKILNGGFRSPDLIVLGGRPSMGKTQFAIHFAEQAALQGKHIFFVSIEQTHQQLISRMSAKDISYSNLRTGKLSMQEWHKLEVICGQIINYPMHIADNPDCRYLTNIKSMARKLKRNNQIDLLIIDYLQLIRTNQRFERRYIEVGYITGELKALAKELKVPIILLAQLSRPSKGQEKEMPKMEDLRESGDIEQDADIIIFPHRPSYYDEYAAENNGRSWKNRGLILVAKNREGERNANAYFKHDQAFKQFFDDTIITATNYSEQTESNAEEHPF